jgi:lysophospholipid acyltransferase (LPLAT)-like uncharacterized protein
MRKLTAVASTQEHSLSVVGVGQTFSIGQRIALAIVPKLAALLIRGLDRTLRYELVAEQGAKQATPPGVQVWCIWHRCLIACACFFPGRCEPMVLISVSFDGELVARTIQRLGVLTARGSSSRFGGSGLWALAKGLERGHPVVFTADGPRGPIYKVKPGAVKLAQQTGQPIGIFYAHPERAWMLKSWDRLLIPKPFSRVAISWGLEVTVPPSEDPQLIEAKILEVEAALERVRFHAEQYFDQAEKVRWRPLLFPSKSAQQRE